MDRSAEALAAARNNMVDSQVRPNKVTDGRLLAALRQTPRERFLPPHLRAVAYADEDVPLGGGRVLMQPMVLARLLQIAAVRDGERALVVGAGVGYGAAILEHCGARVVALEQDPALLALSRPVLAEVAPHVAVVEGPMDKGWPAGAPYDLILIEGAVEHIPAAFAGQLAPAAPHLGGRLVAVCQQDGVGKGGLAERTGDTLAFQPVFDCATPLLPALRRAPGFVF